jgi:hypothetical protein
MGAEAERFHGLQHVLELVFGNVGAKDDDHKTKTAPVGRHQRKAQQGVLQL